LVLNGRKSDFVGAPERSKSLMELQDRHFVVDSLYDPESPDRPLDRNLPLTALKGKTLQIKLREGLPIFLIDNPPCSSKFNGCFFRCIIPVGDG
jgi:hypothetical protein